MKLILPTVWISRKWPSSQFSIRFNLPPEPALLSRATAEKKLKTLQQRRPDLIALQAGYQSQEAKVRTAILSQFPSLSIGITRAKDTSASICSGWKGKGALLLLIAVLGAWGLVYTGIHFPFDILGPFGWL